MKQQRRNIHDVYTLVNAYEVYYIYMIEKTK